MRNALLLLALLARGPGDLAPMITPLPAPQSDEPVVASVNGNVIPYSGDVILN